MIAELDEQSSIIDENDEINEKEINDKQGKNNTNSSKDQRHLIFQWALPQ